MVNIEVRPDELAQGHLDADRHAEAVRAIREDGFVVLTNVASQESIQALRDKVLEDTKALLARPDTPFNWTKGNLQQNPPPFPPYLFRDILVNDVVISITKSILGNGMKNAFYSGNTALPSESRQPVHADEGQLWPDLEVAPPPHSLVVNFPLVDMGPENGSTEIWPGTHLDTAISLTNTEIEVPEATQASRRELSPPLQPVVKAGSAIIRDIRMWHAGMPNRTENPRPMVAMIHTIGWWPTGKLQFPKGSEEFLSHPDLQWMVEYTDDVIDHISQPGGYKAPA